MCKSVTILVLDTDLGTDVQAFDHPDLADEAINSFVRGYWQQEMGDKPMPENIVDAVEAFFQRPFCNDWYKIEEMIPYSSIEEAGW